MLGLTLGDALEHLFRFRSLERGLVKAVSLSDRRRLEEALSVLEEMRVVTRVGDEYRLVDPLRAVEILQGMGVDVSRMIRFVEWRDFEKYIAEVLEEEGYEVFHDVKRSSVKRFQIDVLAINTSSRIALVVECKRWSRTLSALAKLVEAARNHLSRVRKLAQSCEWVAVSIPALRRARILVPVIVTLAQPQNPVIEGVPIVSVLTLRDFVRNAPDYIEELGCIYEKNRCFVESHS